MWVSYREQSDGRWHDDPLQCPAAPVFRLGIYLINDLLRFFGKPRKVQVLSSRIFTGRPTADNAQLGLLFDDGGIVNVFGSFCVKDHEHYKNQLVFNFENGTVYRNAGPIEDRPDHDPPAKLELVADRGGEKIIERAEVWETSGGYQWANFRRALDDGPLPDEIDPGKIVEAVKVVQAMRQAEQSDGIAEVDS